MSLILAGDIGGTKTLLGIFREQGGELELERDRLFVSGEYRSFEDILGIFLEAHRDLEPEVACFGVAGPVLDGTCDATNLPWSLSETGLGRLSGIPRIKLLNDIEAAGYGMLHLPPHELSILNRGAGRGHRGNIGVIAAGTGLGEAILYWDGERHHPSATEGGHTDFAPDSEDEIALLQDLRASLGGHVSYERVLSGPGLYKIHSFLRRTRNGAEPAWLSEQLQRGDPSPTITRVALAGEDPVCAETLEMFAHIYGMEAGNLALKCMAVGGVFVGGGIAPKILPVLAGGGFMRGFTHKGRFADLLAGIEVSVALNTRAPLIGAAHYALLL